MKVETAVALQNRLNRELAGLQRILDQLSQPETGSTMAGLKSALTILARSLLRTSKIAFDIVSAEAEPPAGAARNGHFHSAPAAGREALDSLASVFK